MALFRLERIEEARAMFERLEELMSDEELLRFYSKAAKQWEDECRHLLEGVDVRPDRSEDTESGE